MATKRLEPIHPGEILEEDFEKERFFAFARRTYWDSPADSPVRALMRTLIGKLEF